MTATQTQLRRGTAAQCDAMTPADGEVVVDTTNERVRVGDGSRLGGYPVPNFIDCQQMSFNFAVAGGTANAITVTLSPPVLSLAQPLTVMFRATATNTGTATLNVNGLGAINLRKISGGALTALAAGDIINGGLYIAVYDGTQFQIYGLTSTGLTSVSQGDLNTSIGTVSKSSGGTSILTLPGGQYGFYPQVRSNMAGGTVNISTIYDVAASNVGASYSTRITISQTESATIDARQRYITSSPPFNLGDGETGGFIFARVDNSGGVIGTYAADVPPWAYNGPTDIRCTHKCPITGKKYRKHMKKLTPDQIMNGAKIEYEMQEITDEIKNADMNLIPHPFSDGDKVVMIDPMSDSVRRLIEIQNSGDTDIISEMLNKGHLKIDNDKVSRKGPKGVHISPVKYRSKKNG